MGTEIVRDSRASEQDVGEVAAAVGDLDTGHDAAVFDDLGGQLAGVDPEPQEVGMGLEDLDQRAASRGPAT